MEKIIRVLGKRGRSTIPYIIRKRLGMEKGDMLSYELEGNTVIVRKENLCECEPANSEAEAAEWQDELRRILGVLGPSELQSALVSMSVRWAEMNKEGGAR